MLFVINVGTNHKLKSIWVLKFDGKYKFGCLEANVGEILKNDFVYL